MANSSNKSVVPEAREALNKFKMEAASEVGQEPSLLIPTQSSSHLLSERKLKLTCLHQAPLDASA